MTYEFPTCDWTGFNCNSNCDTDQGLKYEKSNKLQTVLCKIPTEL